MVMVVVLWRSDESGYDAWAHVDGDCVDDHCENYENYDHGDDGNDDNDDDSGRDNSYMYNDYECDDDNDGDGGEKTVQFSSV